MNNTEKAIAEYQAAVKNLLNAAFAQLHVEDPQSHTICARALQTGGMVALRSCTMAGSVLETVISVVDATGESAEIFRLETGVVNH